MLAGRPLRIVRHARARTMRLRLDARSGQPVLTLPPRASQRDGLAWARSKEDWVRRALASQTQPQPISNGMTISVGGVLLRLDHEATHPRNPRREGGLLLVGGAESEMPNRVIRWLKREAVVTLSRETHAFAAQAGVSVAAVGIGDPKSRWGSCTSGGSIRYSWRLILVPDDVRRATVAHEVAHRVHMNHGLDFHALVSSLLGAKPRKSKDWLRVHGAELLQWGQAPQRED